MTPHDRHQARDDRRDCHHLWPQAQKGPFLHRLEQGLARQPAAQFLALLGDRLLKIDHHDNRRLHRRAEERDEADPDGDGHVVPERVQQIDAARQRERHGEQHLRRVEEGPVRQIQHEVDHQQHRGDDDLEPLARTGLVLVLAAPFHVGALRQRYRPSEHRSGFVHEAADVAASNVQKDGDHQ